MLAPACGVLEGWYRRERLREPQESKVSPAGEAVTDSNEAVDFPELVVRPYENAVCLWSPQESYSFRLR